jgi:hypothetical protein
MDQSTLSNWFQYHPPTPDQLPKYTANSAAALEFANIVNQNAPTCADKGRVLGLSREARMSANAAISGKHADKDRETGPQYEYEEDDPDEYQMKMKNTKKTMRTRETMRARGFYLLGPGSGGRGPRPRQTTRLRRSLPKAERT